jgi:arginyl-tRNA synthetase
VLSVLPDADVSAVKVRPCADPKHGDYACPALIGIAKQRRLKPIEFADKVANEYNKIANADPQNLEIGITMEIVPPGFFNFRLSDFAVAYQLERAARGEHLFFAQAPNPKTAVIDFSSPNVAKPMHVGHIRSTILGDCLARTLRLLGHRVITDNHIGDWGTQFGKLLVGWKKHLDPAALKADPIGEMERLYKLVNAASEADEKVLEEARQELVKLQAGDAENLRIWREMIALSQKQFDTIYARLGLKFDHALGESFYNPRLKPLVDELLAKGLARESEGAIAIFFDDIPQLKERPALIRKNDGGFNYATTDLATLAYRLETWHPDEIIYVTDGRQQLHFQQVFTAFRRWQAVLSEGRVTRAPNSSGEKSMGLSELAPPKNDVKLAHVWFGSILGRSRREAARR